MTETYHTAIATGAAANASTFNDPLGDLDLAIAQVAAQVAMLDEVVDDLIIESGTSDAETIAARGGYDVLDERLDDLNLATSVFYVDANFNGLDAAGRYTTISAALADCTGGETIHIAPGIYTGDITVADDAVKLIGSGAPYYDSGSGRLVNGTIIRGRIQLNSVVGVEIYNLGVDLFGVNSKDCIAGATVDTALHRRFHNLTLLGNGNGALSHGLYCAGHYNEVNSVRIYNCYHGIAVHGSYTNINNIGLYACNGSGIIVKAKSGIDCLHININNVTMEGDPGDNTTRAAPIIIQTEDSCETRYVNVSNVTVKYAIIGAVFCNRSDSTGTISEVSFTNIASDGNKDNATTGDFCVKSGNNIIFVNCRSTNRVTGYGFRVDTGDNAGDVYLYSSYADGTGSGTTNGTFKAGGVNGAFASSSALVAPTGYRSQVATLADDTVLDISLTAQGILFVMPITGANSSTVYLMASFRANGTPVCTSMSAGSNVNVSTSTLTGTTGTDGKVTVSATSGHIYVENRLGISTSFNVVLFC